MKKKSCVDDKNEEDFVEQAELQSNPALVRTKTLPGLDSIRMLIACISASEMCENIET